MCWIIHPGEWTDILAAIYYLLYKYVYSISIESPPPLLLNRGWCRAYCGSTTEICDRGKPVKKGSY